MKSRLSGEFNKCSNKNIRGEVKTQENGVIEGQLIVEFPVIKN